MSCKVLLTGISGWIGKHIAIQLLNEGHHVVGTVRNENLIEPTKQTLKSKLFTDTLGLKYLLSPISKRMRYPRRRICCLTKALVVTFLGK